MCMDSDDKQSQKIPVWQTYKVPIILGSVSLFLIVLSLYLLIRVYQSPEPIQFEIAKEQQSTASATVQELIIDVSGAVKKSGVYRLPFGSRVDDAIVAAGGMTREADVKKIDASINRAAKLSDGAKVYIPYKKDETSIQGVSTSQSGSDNVLNTATLVSINSANSSDLERLNGIGPITAAKIINGRPYSRLEELVEKKAMSQSLFDTLKSQLTLSHD